MSCGVLAVLVIAVYNWIWYNRYAPLPEGWFSVYADLIRKGQLPYRDIYFFLPPVYPLFITAVQAVLGPKIIMLRLVGVGMILIFTGAFYKILHDCFGPAVACFAAAAGMIYYQSGVAHVAYDFFQLMNLAAMLAAVCLMRFERDLRLGRQNQWTVGWALAAGFFAAVALFTKQSNGFFIAGSCAVAVVVGGGWTSREWAVRGLVWFCLGGGVLAGALGLWLVATGSLTACLGMIFGGAAAAKGGPWQALFGFISVTFNGDLVSRVMALFILTLPFGFGSIWLLKLEPRSPTGWSRPVWSILGAMAGAGGLLAAVLIPWLRTGGLPGWMPAFLSNYVTLSMIPSALLGTGMILAAWAVHWRQQRQSAAARSLYLAAILSAGLLWGNGTSGGLSEGGAFFGFSLFLGLLLYHGGWLRSGAVAAAFVMCVQLCISAEVKYRLPYDWWGVEEPDIRLPHEPAHQPLQQGLWVTPDRNAVFDRITAIIRRETRPGDPILIFPQTPIFYLLANRPMMGKAVAYWFDFLPDNLVRKEEKILEARPPALILVMDMPEVVWRAHEVAFRDGRPCEQRKMVATINQMQKEGMYDEIAAIPVYSTTFGQNYTFRVLKRR